MPPLPRPLPSLSSTTSHPANRVQVYLSRHTCPFANLSLEHHLLTHSHPASTVLFLYANAPCVVVGRNQNPWVEVNVPLLSQLNHRSSGTTPLQDDNNSDENVGLAKGSGGSIVHLVRRRSGGGTVFHDLGNANYSVICPPDAFTRDKHAEMVVRALRKLNAPSAHVNARHDICITATPTPDSPSTVFKVSGSAYKLTRLRALHHGTCLLSSPNLPLATRLLRSSAQPFAQARGVESVRSRIRNIGITHQREWQDAVVAEFEDMYGPASTRRVVFGAKEVDETEDGVAKGRKELMSREWIYGQTPLFSFSSHPTESDPRERPPLPFEGRLHLEAKHGVLTNLAWNNTAIALPQETPRVWEAESWKHILSPIGPQSHEVGRWLDATMGTSLPEHPR